MQKSTGSFDFTNGSQNCFRTVGRVAYQIAVAAIAMANSATTNAVFHPRQKVRCACGAAGSVETGSTASSEVRVGSSRGDAGIPEGWPGQENWGA